MNNQVMISYDIAEDLSKSSITVLIKLAETMDSECVSVLAIGELAAMSNYSVSTVKRSLNELEANGAIKRGRGVYTVCEKYVRMM